MWWITLILAMLSSSAVWYLIYRYDCGKSKYQKLSDYFGDIIFNGIVFGMVALVVMAVASFLYPTNIQNENSEYELVSLSDGSEISGQIRGGIFLTTGYIEEQLHYYGYRREGDQYRLVKIPADMTLIETDNDNPRYLQIDRVYKCDDSHTWTKWLTLGCIYRGVFCDNCIESTHYRIYVPEGSIVEGFTLDAQ